MSPRTGRSATDTVTDDLHSNRVSLVGRLARAAAERELPSGDLLCTFRLVVARDGERPGPRVDALECVTWSARLRRSVRTWRPGDVVQVEGSLRRRFFRAGGAVASRVEVEAVSGRVVRRAPSA